MIAISNNQAPRYEGVEHLLVHVLAFFLLTLCGISLQAAETPKAPIPYELQPYRIRVSVAFADSPTLDADIRQAILQELPISADRVLGEMWSVTAEENRWLLPTSTDKLTTLTAEQLPPDWKAESHDKSFVITIEEAGGEYVVSGREWDQVGRQLGEPESRRIPQRQELPDALFALCRKLFRPLMAIDRSAAGIASITLKAGALTPADPSALQIRKGQFWQPFLRYRTSKGEVDRVQVIPWTMLHVEEIGTDNPAHASLKVISGLRSALPTRKRSRVEVLARALEPMANSTELRLMSRQNPNRPLVGLVVDAKVQTDAPAERYLTDRQGTVRIPVNPDSPIVWLYARSGEKVLARLPLVPGLLPRVQAELPDDSIRLRVEGELDILESNLTDTVAQRAVLIARIRKHVQLNDWKPVPQLLKEIELLPGIDFYLKELTSIRVPAMQAAQAAKDKAAAAYIDRACGDTSRVIQKYLDDEKLRVFQEELKEIKKAQQSAPKVVESKTPEKKAQPPAAKPAPASPPDSAPPATPESTPVPAAAPGSTPPLAPTPLPQGDKPGL